MTEHTKRIKSLRQLGSKKQEQIADLRKQVKRIKFRMEALATVYEDQRDKLRRALDKADAELTKAQQVKIKKGLEVYFKNYRKQVSYQGTVVHIFPAYKHIRNDTWKYWLGEKFLPGNACKADVVVVRVSDVEHHVFLDKPSTWVYTTLKANIKGNWEQIRGE